MQSRRDLLGGAAAAAMAAFLTGTHSTHAAPASDEISLAAWSLVRSFRNGKWKLVDLPRICRENLGIGALEFVNQFFENPVLQYLQTVKRAGKQYEVKFVRIMVDGEGEMAAVEKKDRLASARAHRKWVDIAYELGCADIRCNMRGGTPDWKNDKDLVKRAAEAFNDLLEYARPANIDILIENHGGASSDPDTLVAVMKAVNNPHFGTLPDYGNVNLGDDRYEVMRKILPYAKGVSVKAAWTADGNNVFGDLEKLIKITQESGFHGFWGIESSYNLLRGQPRPGERPAAPPPAPPEQVWADELKGVQMTKAVLERTVLKK
jgi:L-ribulose-5-phosphate 3-epimerase